jgi:uncharacterized membrane protein YeaQ/YmgE (transglycosylase-associated protein family)
MLSMTAHRSPQFRSAFAEQKLVPPLDRQLVAPLSETKNCATFCPGDQPVKPATAVDRTPGLTSLTPLIRLVPYMDFSVHSIIWVLVIGLVVGAIAKLLMPGKDPGGCIITILLGIAGAFVGTWIGRLFAGENYVAGWIMSIVGAMILLLLYRLILRRRM